jgi:isoleucyl-tRNA synthetase
MSFEKVPARIDFPEGEREVLAFWERVGAFETLRARNAGNATYAFLDGPITANNPMGVHHAWGRTCKDVFQRYHAGLGRDTRYQNGFDCQGLWVEVEVEKERGFTTKREIEAYGIDRFVEDCKERVRKFSAVQAKQSQRLGYWMDWTDSYFTMSDENNYSIWRFLHQCHEKGYIYKGVDVMPWCARCGTGLSQMELTEGYRAVTHTAVFVVFPLRERPDEALLVWTTTPWTLTSNVAAAVAPGLTYLRVKAGERTFYVAKANYAATRRQPATPAHGQKPPPGLSPIRGMLLALNGNREPEVVGEVQGADLVGLTYDGPYDALDAAAGARAAHRVVAWDQVAEGEGTGIVHIAPGCGSEDYHLGNERGLPRVVPIDDSGNFVGGFGEWSGRNFNEVSAGVIDDLKTRGLLVAKEPYFHRYPHCWRCKSELAYRLVDEWYISMSWRGEIMDAAKQARWIPEWGLQRELDWLKNMGDWMISKKRYWGLALPIWECGCGHVTLVRDREDLQARATEGWEAFDGHSPHRPWVDGVKIRCPKCGNDRVSRIKDVGNPWLDASIVPFSTQRYFTDRAYFDRWFPADLVLESLPGQFRNWFYALLAVSAQLTGLVLDEHHEEMHKSKGNAIWFDDAAESIGADVMRWMYCAISPEQNLAFGPGPADEKRRQVILPLWNVHRFLVNLVVSEGFDPRRPAPALAERNIMDRWILAELHAFLAIANQGFAAFDTLVVCQAAERFVELLSNWYVRRSRNRFHGATWTVDRRAAFHTLFEVLDTFVQAISPVVPFLAERLYQGLGRAGAGERAFADAGTAATSVHHRPYPQSDAAYLDDTLCGRVQRLLDVVAMSRSVRNANRLKVRQPLSRLVLVPRDAEQREAIRLFEAEIREELNTHAVEVRGGVDDLRRVQVKLDFRAAGPAFGKQVQAINAALLATPASRVEAAVASGGSLALDLGDSTVELPAAMIVAAPVYAEGWVGGEHGGLIALFDSRITPELEREGLARELIHVLQQARKDAALDFEDRVIVSLTAEGERVQAALDEWRATVGEEVLVTAWEAGGDRTVEVPGGSVRYALRRAGD